MWFWASGFGSSFVVAGATDTIDNVSAKIQFFESIGENACNASKTAKTQNASSEGQDLMLPLRGKQGMWANKLPFAGRCGRGGSID